jgi:hypothetical protein
MNIRRLEKQDVKEIYDIHQKFYNFAFPDLSNPLYAIQRVVLNNSGKIILTGIIRLTSEVILIIDKDQSNITRTKAIKLLNDQLYKDATNFGLDDFHIFAENDDNFINILRKLGFIDSTGFPMVRLK